jgi:hypothetical protein
MKTDTHIIEEWTGHRQPPSFPWVRVLLVILTGLIIAFSVGCGTEYPITLSVHSDHGKASYSSKGGLEITIEK